MKKATPTIVHELISQAALAGADAIEIEYKDGFEEVVAMRGSIEFGIAAIRHTSAKAQVLLRSLYEMANRRTSITVDETDYDVCVALYKSFGEDAFRVEFKRAKRSSKAVPSARSQRAIQTKPGASRLRRR